MQYFAVSIRRLSAEAGAGALTISPLASPYLRYEFTGLDDLSLVRGGILRPLIIYGNGINVTLSASGRFSFELRFEFTCEFSCACGCFIVACCTNAAL